MKLIEIVPQYQLTEGWKNWAAAAGFGAAALVGSVGDRSDVHQKQHTPQVTQSQQSKAINKGSLAKKMLASATNQMERVLIMHAIQAGMDEDELRQFIAQCAHETGNFTHLVELGNDRYISSLYDKKYAPRKAKALGNINAGDGVKYKGRGFIQLTGRYNYARAGEALGLPLERHPELVERPDVAAKVAIWFWKQRVAPKVNDFSNVKMATKPINPGLHGLKSRETHFDRYASIQ